MNCLKRPSDGPFLVLKINLTNFKKGVVIRSHYAIIVLVREIKERGNGIDQYRQLNREY